MTDLDLESIKHINTDRLILKVLDQDDYHHCLLATDLQKLAKYPFDDATPFLKIKDRVHFAKLLKRYEKSIKDKSYLGFGVFQKEDQQMIGWIDISVINSRMRWGNLLMLHLLPLVLILLGWMLPNRHRKSQSF